MESKLVRATSQVKKNPAIITTTAFKIIRNPPSLMSRLRDKSIPIISKPPVDPLQLKTRPIPAPAMTPPKIDDKVDLLRRLSLERSIMQQIIQ